MTPKEIRDLVASVGMQETTYDPKSEADVKRLAEDLGKAWGDAIGPLAALVDEDLRGIFFGHLFSRLFGVMGGTIGFENSEAVAKVLLEGLRAVSESRGRVKH